MPYRLSSNIEFQELAKELVELGGGPTSLLQNAKSAFENKKYQWALKLCDALIETKSEEKEAKVMKYELNKMQNDRFFVKVGLLFMFL